MSLDDATRARIQSEIDEKPVVLFMKGTREAPQCGFSATVVRILDRLLPRYHTIDVLAEPAIREGVKEFSSWPTVPQLYVRGEFLGGSDIVQELFGSGELHEKLGIEVPEAVAPSLEITDVAVEALREATGNVDPGQVLHLAVSARHQSSLFLAPAGEGEIEVESNGITLWMDALSAGRARDARIDVARTPRGNAFQVSLPHAPSVKAMDVAELKRRLDAGEGMELLDVRTPEERETASIPGAVLLDQEEVDRLESLPADTTLVFHCHHGGRSQSAAEHFAGLGFTDVWNVTGGIDAWSQEIDPNVPRY